MTTWRHGWRRQIISSSPSVSTQQRYGTVGRPLTGKTAPNALQRAAPTAASRPPTQPTYTGDERRHVPALSDRQFTTLAARQLQQLASNCKRVFNKNGLPPPTPCHKRHHNPLMGTGNSSATSKLVHWPLLHLVQRGGDWAGPQPAQAPTRCTKCNSPPHSSKKHRCENKNFFLKTCFISNNKKKHEENIFKNISPTRHSQKIAYRLHNVRLYQYYRSIHVLK